MRKRFSVFYLLIIIAFTAFIGFGPKTAYAAQTHTAKTAKSAKQAAAPAKKTANELTVEQVVQLVQAGLGEDLIITEIKKNGKPFDLSADQLIQLKKSGVSDNIIKTLMNPSAQLIVPATTAATAETLPSGKTLLPVQPKKQDPAILLVPEEAGIYYLNGAELVKIDLKTMASAKVAGRLGHQLTFGIKSVKTNAYLIGPSARTRVKETSPTFYIRLPEGSSIDEIVLVSLYVKPDRRELEVAAQGGIVGSKQGLRMEAMRPFESQELGPRLYKIAANILSRGEYLFYMVGSADTIRGIQGKGYDFGIE